MDEFSLSAWLENEMKRRDMTQAELAKLCGVTEASMSHYVNCKRSPALITFQDMLAAMGKRMEIVDK